MSRRLLKILNNDYLINFCEKNLIIDQQAEIYLMNNLLHNLFNYESVLLNNTVGNEKSMYISTLIDTSYTYIFFLHCIVILLLICFY